MSLEMLQRFCADRALNRASLLTPFSQTLDGQAWGIGSDGTRLLMLADFDTGREDFAPNVGNVLASFDSSRRETSVDLAAFAEFLGVPASRETCGNCDGGLVDCPDCGTVGVVDCECSCGDCHTKTCEACNQREDGRVLCPCQKWRRLNTRRVMVGDALFDAGLLAASLADAERCEGTATWVCTTPDAPHMLRGEGWRLIIMPRRIGLGDAANVGIPHFEIAEQEREGGQAA